METKFNPGIDDNLPAQPVQSGSDPLSILNDVDSGIEGDFGAESSRIPFFGIAQKTSDITEADRDALGNLVYAGKVVIPKPAVMSIYGARQYYVQNLPFERNPTVRARTFRTKEQVFANGGNLNRGVKAGADDNNYLPEMICKIVIFAEVPKGKKTSWAANDAVLSYPAGNGNGTLAVPLVWILRKTAYGEVVPPLRMINRALKEEGKEIGFVRFSVQVAKRTFTGGNSTFVPVLERLPDDNPKEVVETMHSIFAV